jgi:hypothetical protein
MSNVLIGIIGVILFIGLALAGALILGDDFKSASNESKAAAVMTTLSQLSSGANMYNLKTGAPYASDQITSLVPRFVKSIPGAVGESYIFGFRMSSGPLAGGPMGVALTAWAPGSVQGRAVCAAIAQNHGFVTGSDGEPPAAAGPTAAPAGCIRLNAVWGGVAAGTYVAWSRI